MSKKDKTLVGVILVLALALGLVLVHQGLLRAGDDRAAYMEGLLNREETPAETEETPAAEDALSALPAEPPTEEAGDAAPEETEELLLPPETAEPELGDPPALSGTEVTLEGLVDWLRTESSGAQEAQAAYEREAAVAVGAGDDAELRAFAEEQLQPNLEARENALVQTGTTLGLELLRCRDLLALEEEHVTFLETLLEAVDAQGEPGVEIPAQTELKTADREKVSAALEEARTAVTAAQGELQKATEAVNAATGRELTETLTMSGELTRTEDTPPDEETAAVLAKSGRNEVKAALRQITVAQQQLTALRYEAAPDSPELLEAQQALAAAQANYPAACSQVEADARNCCRELAKAGAALEACPAVSAPAAAYAIAEAEEQQPGQPKAWVSDLAGAMDSWNSYAKARGDQIRNTAQYNLTAVRLQHAVGVGTAAAAI